MNPVIEQECGRRNNLYSCLHEEVQQSPPFVSLERLNDLRIYRGTGLIYRDLDITRELMLGKSGIAVSLKIPEHTPGQGPPALPVRYDYPAPAGRETSNCEKVQSLRNAMEFHIPVFVVTPSDNGWYVQQGMVSECNEESEHATVMPIALPKRN